MIRILVTGSRNWPFPEYVEHQIEEFLHDNRIRFVDAVIVHGDCPTGADKAADDWARKRNVLVIRYPADWNKGRSAGPKRNAAMVRDGADICLAFQVGNSKGTQNTIDLCKKAGIPVHRITTSDRNVS